MNEARSLVSGPQNKEFNIFFAGNGRANDAGKLFDSPTKDILEIKTIILSLIKISSTY